jgi:Dehydrogenases with different specificities (related to short-chain alcohol dehydrogenases)
MHSTSPRFQNRVALVTGAASGMGLLAAQCYAREGAKVALTDVNQEAVEAAAAGIRESGGEAIGLVVDVRRYEQIRAAVARATESFGSIDILLNCAGGAARRVFGCGGKPWHELPPEVVEWGVDVNLKGAVFFSHAVLGKMIEQKRGVIVSLGSVDGLTGSAGAVEYSACKSGLIGLTKSLSLCGAPHGVRACCVSPGPVLTRPAMANMKTALGRAAEPIEVVNLILYLSSDDAAFITGANYTIDGGRSCGAGC